MFSPRTIDDVEQCILAAQITLVAATSARKLIAIEQTLKQTISEKLGMAEAQLFENFPKAFGAFQDQLHAQVEIIIQENIKLCREQLLTTETIKEVISLARRFTEEIDVLQHFYHIKQEIRAQIEGCLTDMQKRSSFHASQHQETFIEQFPPRSFNFNTCYNIEEVDALFIHYCEELKQKKQDLVNQFAALEQDEYGTHCSDITEFPEAQQAYQRVLQSLGAALHQRKEAIAAAWLSIDTWLLNLPATILQSMTDSQALDSAAADLLSQLSREYETSQREGVLAKAYQTIFGENYLQHPAFSQKTAEIKQKVDAITREVTQQRNEYKQTLLKRIENEVNNRLIIFLNQFSQFKMKIHTMEAQKQKYGGALVQARCIEEKIDQALKNLQNSNQSLQQRLETFQTSCLAALSANNTNILSEHRGCKKIVGILIGILISLVTIGTCAPLAWKLGLFSPRTDSGKKADDLRQTLQMIAVR